MDSLGQTFNQVDIIERHLKYLRCLQHVEELRYCKQRRGDEDADQLLMIEMCEQRG